jgi:hypothetical protein
MDINTITRFLSLKIGIGALNTFEGTNIDFKQ